MYEDRVIIDPGVRHGKPFIKNTRVPVDIILGSLVAGVTIEKIMEEYGLEREDILAAIEYATKIVAKEEIKV